jgi:hypothetical protein
MFRHRSLRSSSIFLAAAIGFLSFAPAAFAQSLPLVELVKDIRRGGKVLIRQILLR